MDRRTKILAMGFGAVIAYLLVAQVVYPNWIHPLFTIDQRVAERRADLEKLEKLQQSVDEDRLAYRDYVARIGTALAVALLVVTVVGVLAAPWLVYLLASGFAATPGKVRRNAPDTIPISVIGRLAVSRSRAGRGLDRDLPSQRPVLLDRRPHGRTDADQGPAHDFARQHHRGRRRPAPSVRPVAPPEGRTPGLGAHLVLL